MKNRPTHLDREHADIELSDDEAARFDAAIAEAEAEYERTHPDFSLWVALVFVLVGFALGMVVLS